MKIRYHIPWILWSLVVIILCSIPGDTLPESSFWKDIHADKIVHLGIFGLHAMLFVFALEKSGNRLKYQVAAVGSIVFGIGIELLQTFLFVNRSGDVADAIANAIGVIIALWLWKAWIGKKIVK